MPEKIRSYCEKTGQPIPRTEGEVLRVALEGIALKYRWVLERLEELSGKRLDSIHIIGGGTKNRLLNQLTADATGRTVLAGPVEATAIGNVLMQAIGLGQISSLAEARAVVRNSFTVEEFHPGDRSGWDEAYNKLVELLDSQVSPP
jgi:sugar (pentulose or hexulose) kinase